MENELWRNQFSRTMPILALFTQEHNADAKQDKAVLGPTDTHGWIKEVISPFFLTMPYLGVAEEGVTAICKSRGSVIKPQFCP